MKSCGIYLHPERLIISTSPLMAEEIPYLPHSFHASIKKTLNMLPLRGAHVTAILHPEDYDLFLLDRPPVPEAEMISALRWQIRSWIPFPATEAAIQYFAVPGTHKEKIYVAVSKLETIQQWQNQLEELDLRLKQVTIVELSLAKLLTQGNFRAQDPDQEGYLGLLFQKKVHLQLLMVHHNQLVLTREFDASRPFEELGQGIHQSFTYCQGQKQDRSKQLFLHHSLKNLWPQFQEKYPEFSTDLFLKDRPKGDCSLDHLIAMSAWISEDSVHAID